MIELVFDTEEIVIMNTNIRARNSNIDNVECLLSIYVPIKPIPGLVNAR